MYKLPTVFKEVTVEQTQSSNWTDICFNAGGTPSTLQDIKVVSTAGGHSFQSPPNRFLYWRTNYDVLELIEQSLDSELVNNRVRCCFKEAPILEGLTVHEKGDSVIILVPTVSSIHRIKFIHPRCDKSSDVRAASILTDASSNNVCDPITFHSFNTIPYLPHTAASALMDDEDALFCLALNNGMLLLIQLQNSTGVATSSYLKPESAVPRFLSGLTDVFRGGKSNADNAVISLVVEQIEDDIILFALNNSGQLRIWSCTKLQTICVRDILPTGSTLSLGAQRHMIRKKMQNRNLTLAVYLSLAESSPLLIFKPYKDEEGFQLGHHSTICTPDNLDLVEMIIDCNSEVIWAVWRSQVNGETIVTAVTISSGKWTHCVSDKIPSVAEIPRPLEITPREFYYNLIFSPGLFSAATITKVLNLYPDALDFDVKPSKYELRPLVCIAIESEIEEETNKFRLTDQNYNDLSERYWSKFYLNCVQYQQADRQPNGLLWLNSASHLVVVTKSNLTFYRCMDILENDLVSVSTKESDSSQSYKHLIGILKSIKLTDSQQLRYKQATENILLLEDTVQEIAREMVLENRVKIEIDILLKYNDLSASIRNISDFLYMPETFENSGEYCESFRSDLGHDLVVASTRQIIRSRSTIGCNLTLLILMLDSTQIKEQYLAEMYILCRSYAVLNWCCEVSMDTSPNMNSLIYSMLKQTDNLLQPMLLDSVWSLCQFIWSSSNSKEIAQFLYMTNQHALLHKFAQMRNPIGLNWSVTLIQSYLMIGEPWKAYDLVLVAEDVEFLISVILLFDRAEHSDIVIKLAEIAISRSGFTPSKLPTLYSLLFVHHLKLCHFDEAYNSLEKNPDVVRRMDCLRDLIVTLINANRIDKLLEFPYSGMVTQLEDVLEKRARSLRSNQANIYYSFLYSFYIKHGNFRKAAKIMFEQAYRSNDNETQKRCYAVSLNSLALVNPAHAWVLKNKDDNELEDTEDTVDIFELNDIYCEFELASARTKLQSCPPGTSSKEVMIRLVKANLFRTALRVASLCKLKLEPAFEALATACIRIPEHPDPWGWLILNDISDLVVGDSNAEIIGSRLLEALLMEYEEAGLTVLHKAVTHKILSFNVIVPYWLELSYKKHNPAEFLKLYLEYGEIDEAVKLTCSLLGAMIGHGKENFAIDKIIMPDSCVTCMPLNAIDRLLLELQHHKLDEHYNVVKETVDTYIDVVKRASIFKST